MINAKSHENREKKIIFIVQMCERVFQDVPQFWDIVSSLAFLSSKQRRGHPS
jgi:hypothetical protein